MMYRFNLVLLNWARDLTKATTVCVMFLAGGQDLTKATTVCVRLLQGAEGVQEMPSASSYGVTALGPGHVAKEPARR